VPHIRLPLRFFLPKISYGDSLKTKKQEIIYISLHDTCGRDDGWLLPTPGSNRDESVAPRFCSSLSLRVAGSNTSVPQLTVSLPLLVPPPDTRIFLSINFNAGLGAREVILE
jgi:hypothetical protein